MTATLLLQERGRAHASVVATVPAAPPRTRWPWLLASAAFLCYLAVAWHLMYTVRFEIGDAISRTGAANHVVASRDPHLAAMGFYWMPLPTLSQIPFVLLLTPFARAQFAGPATSALWAALTIPVMAAIGRAHRASERVTIALCLVYAASPIAVWVAADGMSEASSFFFLAVTMLGYTRWWRNRLPGDLVVTAIGLGGLMLCRYETILITAVVAVLCAVMLPRARWTRTIALVSLPAAYLFLLWLFASLLIVKDPFYWYKELGRIGKISGTGALVYDARHVTVAGVAGITVLFVALFGLLLLVLVPFAVRGGWRASASRIGLLAPGFVLPAFLALQLLRSTAPAAARYYYPSWVVAVAVALAFAGDRSARRRTTDVRNVALVAAAAATAVLQLLAFANPRVSNVENEGVLFAPVIGRARPLPPDPAGWDAPFASWRHLFAAADPLLARGDRLLLDTDSAPHATLFTHHPRQLVIPEDRDFEQIVAAPEGRFELIALPDSAGQRGSRYYATLSSLVATATSRGSWQKLGSYGDLTLYRFVAP